METAGKATPALERAFTCNHANAFRVLVFGTIFSERFHDREGRDRDSFPRATVTLFVVDADRGQRAVEFHNLGWVQTEIIIQPNIACWIEGALRREERLLDVRKQ